MGQTYPEHVKGQSAPMPRNQMVDTNQRKSQRGGKVVYSRKERRDIARQHGAFSSRDRSTWRAANKVYIDGTRVKSHKDNLDSVDS